jgi:hypothetical protein
VRLGTAAALPDPPFDFAAVAVAPVDAGVLVLELLLLLPQPVTPNSATAKPSMSSLERI